jgi:hypothetical protein
MPTMHAPPFPAVNAQAQDVLLLKVGEDLLKYPASYICKNPLASSFNFSARFRLLSEEEPELRRLRT